MSIRALTRRAAFSAVAGLAFGPVAALAQPSVRFRGVRVDVGPLRANVGDPTAAWVAEALPGLLAQAFGPYLAPGDRNGATLIARIDFVYLGPSSGGTGPLGSSQDTIAGVLIVHGPRGSIAAETPLQGDQHAIIRAPSTSRCVVAIEPRSDRGAGAGLRRLGAEAAWPLATRALTQRIPRPAVIAFIAAAG